jgi:hypothetical protein
MNGFISFWDVYPRKIGRIAAEKAYARALKRASAGDILAGVERSRQQWLYTDTRFIPHASTWLNAGRWMDEIETPHAPVRRVWSCPHVERCSHRSMCESATILGRPTRAQAS